MLLLCEVCQLNVYELFEVVKVQGKHGLWFVAQNVIYPKFDIVLLFPLFWLSPAFAKWSKGKSIYQTQQK